MMARELLRRVPPRGDRDRARTDGLSALDVRRRVADDEDAIAGNLQPELFLRPALRQPRQLSSRVMIRSKCTHTEAVDVDARGLELDRGARAQIAGEEPEHHIAACLQLIEELAHSIEYVRAPAARELALETAEVALHERGDALIDCLVGVAARAHQIAHDLRIRLSVIVIVGG